MQINKMTQRCFQCYLKYCFQFQQFYLFLLYVLYIFTKYRVLKTFQFISSGLLLARQVSILEDDDQIITIILASLSSLSFFLSNLKVKTSLHFTLSLFHRFQLFIVTSFKQKIQINNFQILQLVIWSQISNFCPFMEYQFLQIVEQQNL